MSVAPVTVPAPACTAFAGILISDGEKPYINPSNIKYPAIITASASAPLSIPDGIGFSFFKKTYE